MAPAPSEPTTHPQGSQRNAQHWQAFAPSPRFVGSSGRYGVCDGQNGMRSGLTLLVGVLIGQWLAFSGMESPADVYRLARDAAARSDWSEAARQWSRAVALPPDNAFFNYMRAASPARAGPRPAAGE